MDYDKDESTPCTGPRWEPPCAFIKWKKIIQKFISFDLHLLISIPLFIIISLLLILEGFLYIIVRFAGRLVEKYSNPPEVRRLIRKARRTESFEMYQLCAQRLDELTGRDGWKYSDDTNVNAPGYDVCFVRRKIQELLQYRKKHEISLLVQCLRTCLDSQLLGTLNCALYSMTFSGTKVVNEELQKEVIHSIEHLTSYIADNPSLIRDNPGLFHSIRRLPKHFGSTALFLSGGAMLGELHPDRTASSATVISLNIILTW